MSKIMNFLDQLVLSSLALWMFVSALAPMGLGEGRMAAKVAIAISAIPAVLMTAWCLCGIVAVPSAATLLVPAIIVFWAPTWALFLGYRMKFRNVNN